MRRRTRLERLTEGKKGTSVSPITFGSIGHTMSSGYRALLQSLDETEKDVSLGLGRSIKIKRPRSSCCCCRCCCRNAGMWICMIVMIVLGLAISIGVPIFLTLPVESNWHWSRWSQWWHNAKFLPYQQTDSGNTIAQMTTDFQTEDRNGTKLMEGYPPEDLGLPETGAGNTSITFVQEAITQLHQMMEWTKEQYDKTPKVPLIIGLTALLLIILTIIWLVVYRKIRRRQRRRTLGKLVTDLQSGKTLLNSDDSEEE